MAISQASAKWTGTLKEGAGSMKGANGFFEAPFTFLSRFEGKKTGTTPEELIGAANAGCFSMFLAAQLTAAGHPPTSIETSATVTLGELGGGPAITKIELTTNAIVPGVAQGLFDEKVAFSKQNCPITRALGGVPEITIKATLG
jgi:lipoyl-dependent peroxiredoxin